MLDRISACIDFRIASVTSVLLVSVEQESLCVCREVLCVLEGIKINILSVGVLAKRSVCLEGIKVTFLVVL